MFFANTALTGLQVVHNKTGENVNASFTIKNNRIYVHLDDHTRSNYENELLSVHLLNILDETNNLVEKQITWSFTVNQNALSWKVGQHQMSVEQGGSLTINDTLINGQSTNKLFELLCPVWYVPELRSGYVPKFNYQSISFAVNTKRSPGVYQDTVVMTDVKSKRKVFMIVSITITKALPQAFKLADLKDHPKKIQMFMQYVDPDQAKNSTFK